MKPLAAVEAAAQAISARNFVTLRMRPSTRELARVVEAMNSLSRKVNEALESETRRAERLQDAAYRDPVTGLLNARGFAARFESSYEGEREPFAGVFAFVELAELGAINRRLGSERCDALLRELSAAMQEAAASCGGFAGRWSGALTVLALPGMSADAALRGLGSLRKEVREALKRLSLTRHDKVSCGGVEVPRGLAPVRHLAAAADAALRQARESADGIMVLRAAPSEAQAAKPASEVVALLADALAAQRVQLVGQVAYRLSDHRALHTEIFSRLRDASGREITAAQFLPVVAAQGSGELLDRVIISQAIEAARAQADTISLNVSIRSVEQESFVQWLLLLLQGDRRLASRLVFEMSESAVLQNEPAVAAFARALAAAGAAFALDNFGLRRDSLALAQRLRPAYIKLAGAQTASMLTNSGARFYAESVIAAARQLDIPVIAQNVEDESLFQAIAALGFAGYQGNLGGRPSPWPPKV